MVVLSLGESFELNLMTNRIINFYVGNDEMDEEYLAWGISLQSVLTLIR